MDRIYILLKRKAGLTFEEFRRHYETSHALLGMKYFGHLLKSYRRNYIPSGVRFSDCGPEIENQYDCITELIFKDDRGPAELGRIASDPDVRRVLVEDEERFLDRSACSSAPFYTVANDLGP